MGVDTQKIIEIVKQVKPLFLDREGSSQIKVKGVADFFRSEDAVTSPTFTIVNEYYGDTVIYHFDAYRIENASFEQCDWMDDYFFGDGICIVEWAENIAAVLPEGYITVKIDKNPDKGTDYREITIC